MTDLLTASQVAAMTGKSARTVQSAAASGALTYRIKLAGPRGAYLFTEADVYAWLDNTPQDAA